MSEHNGDDDGLFGEYRNGEGQHLPNGFKELPPSDAQPTSPSSGSLAEQADGGEHNPTKPSQPYGTDAQGRRMCGAKKRNGDRCRSPAMPNGRCRIHGGLTPHGVASPHYRHGLRSLYMRALPKKLKKGYRAALDDPELLSLEKDIAVTNTQLLDLFKQLEKAESPPWKEALAALLHYKKAMRTRDQSKITLAYAKLHKILRQGNDAAKAQDKIWQEIKDLMGLKSRLVAQDHRRQVDMNVMVPAKEANDVMVHMMDVMANVVKGRVNDPKLARKIMGEISLKILPVIAPQDVIDNEAGRAGPRPE